VPRQRYQLTNHLYSSSVELDDAAALISFEQYSPYGITVYQAGRSASEVASKRYRYTGKERDEETGFGYHQLRLYCPWLARWTSPDPQHLVDSVNLYLYVRAQPLLRIDESGGQSRHHSMTANRNKYRDDFKRRRSPSPNVRSVPGARA